MLRFRSCSGSVLLLSLMYLGILMALAGVTFSILQNRYRQVHQIAAWHEGLLAAESGVDLAVNELRKELFDPDAAWQGWSTTPSGTGTLPSDPTSPALYYTSNVFLRAGEGGERSYSKVSVDAPAELVDASGEQWFRVRSLGVAAVPGGGFVAGEKADLQLRKLDLKYDHRTGAKVNFPQATRLVEAIVKPVGTFRLALFGVNVIRLNNHNIVVDSYDSRDPAKSLNGFYDPTKRQQNGNIATNGTLLEAGNAHIYGSAATNGGTVLNSSNVSGEIRNDFFQELFSVQRPNVTSDPSTPTTITATTTIDARAGAPIQVIVSQINLSGQQQLRIRGAIDGSPTYAQIIVNGAISTTGQSTLLVDPGVHLRIFVSGNIDIGGNGVINANSPLNFQVYGLDRPADSNGAPISPGEVKIAGNGGFRGTIYAPTYDVSMVGGGNSDSIFGSFVGWTVSMTGVQAVHYDEALADSGLISDYKVVSWFEDTR